MGGRNTLVAVLALAVGLWLAVPAAHAAYPGENGKIAFQSDAGILTMDPDGSNVAPLSPNRLGHDPAWSPDGERIAFNHNGNLFVVNADGSSLQQVPGTPACGGATWSPDGSRFAFARPCPFWSHIYSVNTDGSDLRKLTGNDPEYTDDYQSGLVPSWSPIGNLIAYGGTGIVFDDGDLIEGYTGLGMVTPDGAFPGGPAAPSTIEDLTYVDWSPDGSKLAITGPSDGPCTPQGCDNRYEIWVVNADNSGVPIELTNSSAEDTTPAWSPDGGKIAFASRPTSSSDYEIHVMNADGSGSTQLTSNSTDDLFPTWQPVQRPHVRPKSASPIRVSLVPAYKQCTAPNRTHGPALAFPSCSPPQREGPNLTLGIGDGNPALARSDGFLKLVVVGNPGPAGGADISIRFRLTNVMRDSDLSEYTGELRTGVTVRRTDREGPLPTHSTTTDFPFGFTVPCNPTPGSSLDGSTCESFTSVNALIPLAIEGSRRTVWELDNVRVYDGGPDEDADTASDNSLLATQGIFVP